MVIFNCVINLSGDKPRVLAEAARVLRPGARFAVSDVLADEDMAMRRGSDLAQWAGCIAGALTARVRAGPARCPPGGHRDIETNRIQGRAGSAIIRARKRS